MSLKIRYKLFLAILLANILLSVSIYLISSWSFDQSFKQYLDASQAAKLEPLVTAINNIYQQEADWEWLRSRGERSWSQLMQRYVLKSHSPRDHRRPPPHLEPRDHRPPPHFDRGRPPPRPALGLAIDPAILLADSNHKLLIGRLEDKKNAYWIPIGHDENVVGYVGFFRTIALTRELDQVFIKQLKTNFGWIVLGIILLSGLITLPLARQIVKPLETLRHATHRIAAGHYETRVQDSRQDEIGALSRDFNALAVTLEQSLRARQQWIADISHELRTPVAILQGELEALQDGVRVLSKTAIDSLHQEIIRLGRLISDLHQLSLSDLGALTYRKERVNLAEIIEEVIESRSDWIEEKNIDVQFEINADDFMVLGDYDRLTQLFYNLLNNSLAYTFNDGCLEVQIRVEQREFVILWADSKPGVETPELKKLFDRLYRAEESRNRNSGGSGLGLAISKNIVEAHQGSIMATHAEKGGVCFIIKLPMLTS